ncbi:MAG: preprotein translocase subunit YajC [Phycisphaeraceae bacterium]|nr:preprotein translocase subunit YajC [Phycisphaeraceae bacterium]
MNLNFPTLSLDMLSGAILAQTAEAAPPVAGRPSGESAPLVQPGTAAQPGQAPPPGGFGGSGIFLFMFAFLALMIVMQIFSGRKQKKQREQLLNSIARHDRVQTVGGIIGTVAEVRDDEIVLKVDEATNTKLRVARSAISAVLKKSAADGLAPGGPASSQRPESVGV